MEQLKILTTNLFKILTNPESKYLYFEKYIRVPIYNKEVRVWAKYWNEIKRYIMKIQKSRSKNKVKHKQIIYKGSI